MAALPLHKVVWFTTSPKVVWVYTKLMQDRNYRPYLQNRNRYGRVNLEKYSWRDQWRANADQPLIIRFIRAWFAAFPIA